MDFDALVMAVGIFAGGMSLEARVVSAWMTNVSISHVCSVEKIAPEQARAIVARATGIKRFGL